MKKFIPQILENTKNDIDALKKSIEEKNFDEIYRMAHSMKGYAKPFGFNELGDLAIQIQDAAKEKSFDDVCELAEAIDDCFINIEIVYE